MRLSFDAHKWERGQGHHIAALAGANGWWKQQVTVRKFSSSRNMHGLVTVTVCTLGISQQARSTIYLLAGRAHASIDIAGGRPPGGDGAAISGVHRHVGLLQERPGGIGAATCDIKIFPRKCQNQ